MTFGRRTPELFDSREGAQLQRDIVGAIVHELTSITSALALRVDAADGILTERDTQAVAELTAQLRAATRPLVWLRGSPGRGALSPVRTLEVATWWQHTSQVMGALLPRGTHLTVVDEASLSIPCSLPVEELVLFQMLMLGSCRHYTDLYPVGGITMHVTLPTMGDEIPAVTLSVMAASDSSIEPLSTRPTRWKRFCTRTAERAHLDMSWWRQPDGGIADEWQWRACRRS